PSALLVLAHRRRALHREGRQYERRDERAVAPPQLDHRDIASLAPAASVERDHEAGRLVLLEPAEDLAVVVARRRVLEWPRPVVPPVEVRADSGRVERRAVVELDPTAQRERPGLAVAARGPGRGPFRLQPGRRGLQRGGGAASSALPISAATASCQASARRDPRRSAW